MAALRRVAGPSAALTLWAISLLVAPTAARPLGQPQGRSLFQLNVTTTEIPFLTDLTVEDMEGEWLGVYQQPWSVPLGGAPSDELCLSEGCRDAFPAGTSNVSFMEGRRLLVKELLTASLPSPADACQKERMGEIGRSKWEMQMLSNVTSYTPAGNVAMSFWAKDFFMATGGIEHMLPGDQDMPFQMCIKIRAYVTDDGVVKAAGRLQERFQGTGAGYLTFRESGNLGPRCFIPSVDLDLITCQLRRDPDNFIRSYIRDYEYTCITGKCLDIATRG